MYSMYKQTDSDHLEKRAANLNLYKFRPQPKKLADSAPLHQNTFFGSQGTYFRKRRAAASLTKT
jgi:hypothetical protein